MWTGCVRCDGSRLASARMPSYLGSYTSPRWVTGGASVDASMGRTADGASRHFGMNDKLTDTCWTGAEKGAGRICAEKGAGRICGVKGTGRSRGVQRCAFVIALAL